MNQAQSNFSSITLEEYPEVVDLWEASVRATHNFLSEKDIQHYKPLILNQYLHMVELVCLRDTELRIVGFAGVSANKLEMLFIAPERRGQGIGKRLLQHTIKEMGITDVDVNEQNEQAVGFYLHAGFEIIKRSPLDGQGNPFPILHLRLPSPKQ